MRTFPVCVILPLALGPLMSVATAAEIRGSVVLRGDVKDAPAPEAMVQLKAASQEDWRYPARFAQTDAAGRFTFSGLAPDVYELRLTRHGFGQRPFEKASPLKGYIIPRSTVRVDTRTPESHTATFVLELGATIAGHALRADGQPINWAIVSVIGSESYIGTDFDRDTGRFTLYGVPPNEPQRVRVLPTEPKGYQYMRSVSVPADQLKPGETADVGDIRFDPLPSEPNLKGTMVDADGDPVPGLRLYLLIHTSLPIEVGLDVAEGKFEEKIFPGEYKLATPGNPARILATVVVKPEGVTEVKLQDDRPVRQGLDKAAE